VTELGPGVPKLVVLDDAPILGGAELFALRLARFVEDSTGISVAIACPPAGALAARSVAEGLDTLAVRYPVLGLAGVPSWPGAVLRLRRLLADLGPEAIAVANTARAQAYAFAAIPLIAKGRRPALVNVLHEQETLARRSGRFALRRSGLLVPIGANVAAACTTALPGVRIWKANNFVEVPERGPGERRRDGRQAPVLGILARLIPEKGVLELVEELAAARGWQSALIAGGAQDGAYAERIRMRIGSLGLDGRISLLGHVDDVPGFLSDVDVVVVPSTGNEAQPTAVIEAIAYGLPCIVRRPIWSADFDGLPVFPYDGARELSERLGGLPAEPPPAAEVRRRFGPEQALEAILAAGGSGR
jgi:glycosyltransferase involved in cell wall biosynthesis